jgi:hypothetical protein
MTAAKHKLTGSTAPESDAFSALVGFTGVNDNAEKKNSSLCLIVKK